jgi:quinol monooxygenase YgiN
MSKMSIIVKLRTKPGCRGQMLEVLQGLVRAAEDEPGTLQYVFNTADDDPDTIWSFELYRDDDAFAAHSASEAMAAVSGSIGEFVAEPPEIVKATPVIGKGL